MKRKKRILLFVLSVLACLLAALIVWYLYQPGEANLSADEKAAVRKDRERLARNWWEPLRVTGLQGTDWFIPIVIGGNDSRMCWRVREGSRVDVGEFAPREWEFISHQAAILLSDGNLLVVWSGSGGALGDMVAASVNTGMSWSAPVIIATGAQVTCLDVALDANGQPNILYVSPLDPPESYGPIDGFFPYKCWHSAFDGRKWLAPEPIQGRGRFSVDKAILALSPSKRLIASVETHGQFSSGDRYLAVQVLEKSGWSKLTRLRE